VSAVESAIDDLYKGRLDEFIPARTALARSLKGADAARVKKQQKPTAAPWAVNQVYWHARPVYDRLAASGAKLRAAQIAALKGRPADLRRATQAHHDAIAAAVGEATRLAAAAGVHPSADDLARTFGALSLASEPHDRPGRLVKPLQPAGFEALAGVAVKAGPPRILEKEETPASTDEPTERRGERRKQEAARPVPKPQKEAAERRHAEAERRRREADERRRQMVTSKAAAAVARAKAAEARAREAWERSRDDLDRATRSLAALSERGSARRRAE
jgi:hypothetical protein